jgi:hypothetical protein
MATVTDKDDQDDQDDKGHKDHKDERDAIVADDVVHEFGALLGAASVLERIAGRELERRCGIRHAVFEVLLRLSGAGAECPRSMVQASCARRLS